MKKCLFTAFAATSILFSCQKDDTSSKPETPDASEYYPLSTGSYWIYENYKIDTNGVETDMELTDSVYVSGDTLVNGETYFMMHSSHNITECFQRSLRDSSGYLVSPNGYRHFAPNDFRDSLNLSSSILSGGDTLYSEVSQMHPVPNALVVPAGSFDVLMFKRNLDIKLDVSRPYRELKEYRARNVGTVLMQYGSVQNPATFESRLVRYHIN